MTFRVAVLGGDGVGPEVTEQAVRVLARSCDDLGVTLELLHGIIGGAAIDATGDPLPADTRSIVASADAVLLGAVGGPKWSDPLATVRPEQGLLGLRAVMGTFANVRPVKSIPSMASLSPIRAEILDGTDIVFVRELTGGLYFGKKTKELDAAGAWTSASDLCVYTADEIRRVVRLAGTLARARRRRVTSVDKANVLETSRLWRTVTTDVMREEFPDVALDHVLVDSFAMQLIRTPAHYDVVVTENLFGDILTDEAAVLAGSIGLLPSASLGARVGDRTPGLYEPIHGSAPDIAGRGIANPAGAILSVAAMLDYSLQSPDAARRIERAVTAVLDAGICTADCARQGTAPASTRDFGDAVLARM